MRPSAGLTPFAGRVKFFLMTNSPKMPGVMFMSVPAARSLKRPAEQLPRIKAAQPSRGLAPIRPRQTAQFEWIAMPQSKWPDPNLQIFRLLRLRRQTGGGGV
jgi:hypothetical protein